MLRRVAEPGVFRIPESLLFWWAAVDSNHLPPRLGRPERCVDGPCDFSPAECHARCYPARLRGPLLLRSPTVLSARFAVALRVHQGLACLAARKSSTSPAAAADSFGSTEDTQERGTAIRCRRRRLVLSESARLWSCTRWHGAEARAHERDRAQSGHAQDLPRSAKAILTFRGNARRVM